MTRIVTITPLAAENDSRTFKQAASLARLGYESVVVEALPSRDRRDLPFELITAGGDPGGSRGHPPAASHTAGPWWRSAGGRALNAAPGSASRAARDLADELSDGITFLRAFGRRYWLETARAVPEASLYYLHGYFQFPAAYLASRRHRAPLAYDAHDFYPVIFSEDTPAGRFLRRPLLWLDRAAARRAAGFVTVSNGVADLYESAYGRRPRVIRNCHDLRLDEPAASTVRQAAGVGDDDFLVVAVGHAKPGDAFDQMVEAIERCPDDVHVAFVGNQDGRAAAVSAHPAASRLHFLPAVPPRQLSAFIESADVAAILYTEHDADYANALPNRFFFPVAAGLPVLYPPLREIRRLAESMELGVPIDPLDPNSIVAAIQGLASDPDRVAELQEKVVQARPALSWEGEEAVLADMIGGLLLRST
jgi:glycosyltransferase involved in cell wall biosynthesis